MTWRNGVETLIHEQQVEHKIKRAVICLVTFSFSLLTGVTDHPHPDVNYDIQGFSRSESKSQLSGKEKTKSPKKSNPQTNLK